MLKNGYNLSIISLFSACLFFIFLNFGDAADSAAIYFLGVGQGESELLSLGGAKILVDAGYTGQIVPALDKFNKEKYLDLGIVSEIQTDYVNGYNFLLQNYGLGAILWNGRTEEDSEEWQSLLTEAKNRSIPMIPVAAGDIIHYGGSEIKIISPSPLFLKSEAAADTSLVLSVSAPGISALLAGGINVNMESVLIKNGLSRADILKTPAHASKNSSSQIFLSTLKPKISVIASGPKAPPDFNALSRLKTADSLVFQTGLSGTVKIVPKNGKLQVFTEK
jgi:competence protein ComEC